MQETHLIVHNMGPLNLTEQPWDVSVPCASMLGFKYQNQGFSTRTLHCDDCNFPQMPVELMLRLIRVKFFLL